MEAQIEANPKTAIRLADCFIEELMTKGAKNENRQFNQTDEGGISGRQAFLRIETALVVIQI
jgi:hypothetical protein